MANDAQPPMWERPTAWRPAPSPWTSAAGAILAQRTERLASSTGLPPDLEADAARRLRVVSLLYAFVFFVVNPLTALVVPAERAPFVSSPVGWAPSTLSIGVALMVAAATRSSRLAVRHVLVLGLVCQVAGSFGIAAAQYGDAGRYDAAPPWAGLSWVAVWMLSFTIMVPSPPRQALAAALGSASAVPLVAAMAIRTHEGPVSVSAPEFAARVVLPYVLVVVIAYVGSRIVHRLGAALTEARELGSYHLVERLGMGGMGEVWRAEHRLLARPAAIKLIRADAFGSVGRMREAEMRARFEREAQVTSSLRSPHTIELYDFGVADDGTFYYVMELLDGFDLQALVERFGPVPLERAVHLLTQVCHSLSEAHSQALIHRDVKPANIYACRYGRDVDFVKVLDFGLVKPAARDDGPTALAITGTHAARGTPAFMSPEQALGDRPLDERSDIYAIGCLGYWLVTGELVFPGRTPMETIAKHVQAEPEPPSRHSELGIPDEFDALMLACLAKSPDHRPPTADAIAARLASIALPTPWSQARARQWWALYHPAPGTS